MKNENCCTELQEEIDLLTEEVSLLNDEVTELKIPNAIRVGSANGTGSTNTMIRRWSTVFTNVGADITYSDSSTLGGLFTINANGIYSISYSDNCNTANDYIGISVNSTELSTSVQNITAANLLNITCQYGKITFCCSWVGALNVGDKIRCHVGASGNADTPAISRCSIAKVG